VVVVVAEVPPVLPVIHILAAAVVVYLYITIIISHSASAYIVIIQ
jgi:hypothetical protein